MKLQTLITQFVAWRQSLGERYESQQNILNSFCRRIGPEVEAADLDRQGPQPTEAAALQRVDYTRREEHQDC